MKRLDCSPKLSYELWHLFKLQIALLVFKSIKKAGFSVPAGLQPRSVLWRILHRLAWLQGRCMHWGSIISPVKTSTGQLACPPPIAWPTGASRLGRVLKISETAVTGIVRKYLTHWCLSKIFPGLPFEISERIKERKKGRAQGHGRNERILYCQWEERG